MSVSLLWAPALNDNSAFRRHSFFFFLLFSLLFSFYMWKLSGVMWFSVRFVIVFYHPTLCHKKLETWIYRTYTQMFFFPLKNEGRYMFGVKLELSTCPRCCTPIHAHKLPARNALMSRRAGVALFWMTRSLEPRAGISAGNRCHMAVNWIFLKAKQMAS